jgi:protein SCO1/2
MSPARFASSWGLGPLLVACWLLVSAPSHAEPSAPAPVLASSVEEKLGAQLPLATKFMSSEGQELTLGSLLGNGKPALLVLAYSRCTMLCGLVLRGVADTLRGFDWVPGKQFSVVTISIDPEETINEAARMQAALLDGAGYPGQTERWPFLVGKKPDIDAVASQVGFHYAWDPRTEQYAHPAVVFAISPGGKVAGYFYGLAPDRERLRAVLEGSERPGVARRVQDVIMNCFRFDTTPTKYGGTIQRLFQLGAASVGLALLGLVVLLFRAERVRRRGVSHE